MPRKAALKEATDGKILAAHPDTSFSVVLDDGTQVKGYLSRPTIKYYIHLKPGDRVQLQLEADNTSIGIITHVYR